jgi:hypothetical protein
VKGKFVDLHEHRGVRVLLLVQQRDPRLQRLINAKLRIHNQTHIDPVKASSLESREFAIANPLRRSVPGECGYGDVDVEFLDPPCEFLELVFDVEEEAAPDVGWERAVRCA